MNAMTDSEPNQFLDSIQAVASVVREYADVSERDARLADPVVAAMKAAGLFRGLLPKSLGGFEVDPVTWFKAVEAAARVDGSFGWTMFINGSSGLGGRTLAKDDAESLMRNRDTVFAGAVFPFGKAVATDGGYKVSGRWTYASGILHASHVFGVAAISDQPRMLMPGTPALGLMTTPVTNVEIHRTWDVSGLSATGSNDFSMADVFVPAAMGTVLGAPIAPNGYYDGAVYRLPFMTLFSMPMGAVALGIAQHAIDSVLELAQTKVPAGVAGNSLCERPLFHLQLSEAIALVDSARAWLHQMVARQYELACADASPDVNQRVMTQLAASNATRSAARAVELMYLAGGGTANFRKSPLQRCLRDVHAVTQHAGTAPATWEACGAVAAGMPLANPFLLL
jgi:alkylation response protein AidB-like acyl-CoA dehydrogenase